MNKLGIDVGGSMTKLVLTENDNIAATLLIKSGGDAAGAAGQLLAENHIEPKALGAINLTGVGAAKLGKTLLGREAVSVSEFSANALGALRLAQMDEALCVSMGTGTAFVLAQNGESTHIGGSGVGGGTLLGLSRALLKIDTPEAFEELTKSGELSRVDLLVGDMSSESISMLLADVTSSNFGKIMPDATDADYALGLLNMVCQTIGMLAVFALRNENIRDVLLIGGLTGYSRCEELFAMFHKLFELRFHVVPNGIFAGAYGAALQ